jgi:predicted metal-dependent hydrolase
MAFRDLHIEGIPEGVVVRASTRRRKTVTAYREGGVTVVVVPDRMSTSLIRSTVVELVAKLQSTRPSRVRTDAHLHERAERLRAQYLPEAPAPLRVTWSSRQQQRWGSCTPNDRAIRISTLLQDMPDYVIDAVLVHELAHLIHVGHTAEFWQCVGRYEHLERAQAFLAGYSHARAFTPPEPG